jgi:hypothetical protein
MVVKWLKLIMTERNYQLMHLVWAIIYGSRFGLRFLPIWLVLYWLLLETLAEWFILSRKAREYWLKESNEVIQMIHEEIEKRRTGG